MNNKTSAIIIGLIILLGGLVSYEYFRFNDGKLHLVFCDVGQGDGIFIRTPSGKNIVVDAGPDEKIVGCIEENSPFWDRKIELAILTHPHLDHFFGFNHIFKKFTVDYFATESLENDSTSFGSLKNLAKEKGIKINYLSSKDKIRVSDGAIFQILGPSQAYIEKTSPHGHIGESSEFASLIVYLKYKDFEALLTGDSQVEGLIDAFNNSSIGEISVFHVPHHGSKTGITGEIMKSLNPKIAVISVGKNKYGHPTPFTLGVLRNLKIPLLRTDQNGDIEFVSDGKSYYVAVN